MKKPFEHCGSSVLGEYLNALPVDNFRERNCASLVMPSG
jgi:hypothetical protein